MTVSQLMNELRTKPANAEVIIVTQDNDCDHEIKVVEMYTTEDETDEVIIEVDEV